MFCHYICKDTYTCKQSDTQGESAKPQLEVVMSHKS